MLKLVRPFIGAFVWMLALSALIGGFAFAQDAPITTAFPALIFVAWQKRRVLWCVRCYSSSGVGEGAAAGPECLDGAGHLVCSLGGRSILAVLTRLLTDPAYTAFTPLPSGFCFAWRRLSLRPAAGRHWWSCSRSATRRPSPRRRLLLSLPPRPAPPRRRRLRWS